MVHTITTLLKVTQELKPYKTEIHFVLGMCNKYKNVGVLSSVLFHHVLYNLCSVYGMKR